MIGKLTAVDNIREYILDNLEKKKIRAGERIPPAREIALKKGISFIKVQHAIDSLRFDGILETVPRQGTFVKASWDKQRLRNSIFISGFETKKLFGLEKIIKEEIPELRINKTGIKGDFEINVTLKMQSTHNDYMDLSEIFDELFPAKSIFYMKPFEYFRKEKKIYAIPVIFSPRVICFNSDMLKAAGCTLPDKSWKWDDFISLIRKLKTHYKPENIYKYSPFSGLNMIMAFVFRAGGGFIDANGRLIINSYKSKKGLLFYKSLLNELDYRNYKTPGSFKEGNLAFSFSARQEIMPEVDALKFNWNNLPLPHMEGGTDITVQTTEGLCVHKSCTNLKLVKRVVRTMLSERVQNCFAKSRYGIPVRKDIAKKSMLGNDDLRDRLFFNEIPNMSAAYSIDSPEILQWLHKGLNNLVHQDNTDFDKALDELHIFFKSYLEIKKYGI
jgi:DNA-binding transcriptional regulator YhcF (GntR family)